MTKPINTPLDTLQSIRQRRTIKMMSETPLPVKPCDEGLINTLIESAYYAPFHHCCHRQYRQENDSPLPYRFYVLDSRACRRLADKLPVTERSGKIINMLHCADYLIQATWCPQPQIRNEDFFMSNIANMEHIAASGAAIQNILLTATALGYENYWSSGGILREEFTYQQLGIDTAEILLGSLFIFPNQTEEASKTIESKLGKQRNNRGDVKNSYRLINL